MTKSITLKHIGYRCKGTATVNLWDNSRGEIKMDSWDTKKGDKDSIVKGVNDGKFGCEFIESAEVEVYNLYEDGHTVYDNTIIFSVKELTMAKRGI